MEGEKKEQKAIISAISWVSRGFARAQLEEILPSQAEIQEQKALGNKLMKGGDIGEVELADAKQQIEAGLNAEMEGDGDSDDGNMPIFTAELARLKKKEKGENVEDEDEGMEVDNEQYPSEYSDSDEEKDDFTIRKSDNLIVAATAEDDHSNLEVYIYDHKTGDLYVHHEIILGALPLCMEWLSEWQGTQTNHMIVGTFLPEIEIWNLDSENCEPAAILGSLERSEQSKSAGIQKYNKGGDLGTHTEAVMCLSLNKIQKEYLASGSEDSTVRIWDLDDLKCKATFDKLHKDKVQAVRWNPLNDKILLTAGFDSRINVLDVRDQASLVKTKIPKSAMDVEQANWHPTMEHNFAVSTESGLVLGYDSRNMSDPVFSLQAHQKACSNVAFSPHIANMMATCSTDGTVKIWDAAANGGAQPSEMGKRSMQ